MNGSKLFTRNNIKINVHEHPVNNAWWGTKMSKFLKKHGFLFDYMSIFYSLTPIVACKDVNIKSQHIKIYF